MPNCLQPQRKLSFLSSRTFLVFHGILITIKAGAGDISPEKIKEWNSEIRTATGKNMGPAIIGLIFLLLSLAAAIVNLPSFLKLSEQSVYLKVMWRYLTLLAILSPTVVMDFMEDAPRLLSLIYANVFPVFFLSLLHSLYVYLIYFAAVKTFVAHTILLCSIPTTFSATWKIARRLPFTRLEYIGIGANVFGAYLCCCEAPIINSKRHFPSNS